MVLFLTLFKRNNFIIVFTKVKVVNESLKISYPGITCSLFSYQMFDQIMIRIYSHVQINNTIISVDASVLMVILSLHYQFNQKIDKEILIKCLGKLKKSTNFKYIFIQQNPADFLTKE